MTDRTKYQKITTYYQAFEVVLDMRLNENIYKFLKQLEAEGHTEKSISYSIWRTQNKLIQYKGDPRFFSILRNEILKYSWTKNDPRWDDYWKKRNEQEKVKSKVKTINDYTKEEIEASLAKLGVLKKEDEERKNRYAKKYKGYVYFIQGENGGAIKIGYSKDPESRLKSLQTSYPDILKVLCLIPGTEKIEKKYHKKFENIRLNGEWFKPDETVFQEIETLKAKYPDMEFRGD